MENKVKGFFERPEGKTGMIFIVIGIFALLVGGNTIMPYVITALQNTLHAALLGGVLLGLIALVMNNKFRTLCSAFFKSAMRWLTGLFITIDPIGILKNYIDDMVDRLNDIRENIGKLNGQKQKLIRDIEEEKTNMEKAMRMASAAQKQGNDMMVAQNSRKAARSQEFVGKLSSMLDRMEKLAKVLFKMEKSVNFLLEDTKDQVRIAEAEYKSIKAAHKAMKGAEALIQGSSAKDLFEQSMEHIANDIGQKLGEMETFMTLSEDFMANVDLQNGVWDEKGFEMLSHWEETGTLINYEDQRSKDPGVKVRVESVKKELPDPLAEIPATQNQPSEFSAFFKK